MNNKSFIGALAAMAVFAAAHADIPSGYYNALDGKKDVELMRAAKSAVSNHKEISYSGGTWDAFATTDVTYYNGKEIWWDMYSNEICYVSSGHGGLNVEHSVANSWWGGTKNAAYKDLFHLNPSNADANNRKANYPLGEIASVTWTNGVTTVGTPVSGQGGGCNYVYEPPKEYKGDFARAFMYIFTLYNDISWKDNTAWMYDTSIQTLFQPWAVELLLKWAKEDPVSQKEVDRNEAIYKIQNNRNPFIDYPELCEYIWGSKKGTAFSVTGAVKPDPDPEPDPNPKPDPDPDPVPGDGNWHLVKSMAQITPEGEYIVVSVKNYNAMSYNCTATSTAGYFNTAGQALPANEVITSTPEDVAVVRFETQGNNVVMAIYDNAENLKGYYHVAGDKKVSLADKSEATPFTLTIASDGEATFDSGTNGKLKYNAGAPRFTTYSASAQESLSLYGKKDSNVNVNAIDSEMFTFELRGNNITAPAGTMVFDMQGRQAGIHNLRPGIYVVSYGTHHAKVQIR